MPPTGCKHWQPRGAAGKWREAERKAREQARERVAAFREQISR